MKKFKKFISEIFSSSFDYKLTKNGEDQKIYRFKTKKKFNGYVQFDRDFINNDYWEIEFVINDSIDKTGEGESYYIFSTVLDIIQEFIRKFQPIAITFEAFSDDDSNNRAKLYLRLIKYFAKENEYQFQYTLSDVVSKFILYFDPQEDNHENSH